jgi:uncharacterized protein (TIRG00374 family)
VSRNIKKFFPFIFLFVGFFFLYLLLSAMDFGKVIEKVFSVDKIVFLVLFAPLLWYLFYAYGWFLTISYDVRPRFFHLYALMIAYFGINTLTPFLSIGGELLRIKYLGDWIGKKNGIASIFTVLVIFHSSTLVFAMFGIMVLLFYLKNSIILKLFLIAFLFLSFIFILLLASLYRQNTFQKITNFLNKFFPSKIRGYIEAKLSIIVEIDKIIYDFYKHRKKDLLFSYVMHLLGRFVGVFEVYIIFKAMGTDVGFIDSFIIASLIPIVNLIAFFIPYQVGIEEGNIYLICSLLGIDPLLGISMNLIRRFRFVVWIAISLFVAFFIQHQNIKYKGIEDRIGSEKRD